ncbi:MAG: PF20097 family protein [Methanomassiliicoccales archaeon]
MNCPECGKEMEPGFIFAPRPYLFWVEKKGAFHKEYDTLKGDSWTKGAHLPAFRCSECKLLLAHYESYDENVKGFLSGSALTYDQRSSTD